MPLDSLEEFRVTTVGANADQGRTSGAQVSLITKRGSNSFHGSLYEFNRNTAFTANSFFNNEAGVPRPQLVRNVFGVSVGGPTLKNRLFFFFNYEGRRDASSQDVVRPSQRKTCEMACSITITLAAFHRSVQTKSRRLIHLVLERALPYLIFSINSLPNDSTVGDGLAATGYRFLAKAPLSWNTYVTRLDWHVDRAGSHTVFVRGNLQNDKQTGTPQFPGGIPNNSILANAKGIAVGYTHVLNPFLVGTFHYGLKQYELSQVVDDKTTSIA